MMDWRRASGIAVGPGGIILTESFDTNALGIVTGSIGGFLMVGLARVFGRHLLQDSARSIICRERRLPLTQPRKRTERRAMQHWPPTHTDSTPCDGKRRMCDGVHIG